MKNNLGYTSCMADIEIMPHGGKRPGAGRHKLPASKRLADQYPLRCTHAEREAWRKAAEKEGKALSVWMRDTLNRLS